MFKKVVIILSIIYFASAYRISYAEVQEDDVDSLLVKLQKDLDRAIDESQQRIEKVQTFLNDMVDINGYILHYTLEKEKQTYDERVDRVITAAAQKSVNIEDCLTYGKSIIYLPITAFNESLVCTDILIPNANENMNSELKEVTIYADYIFLLKKEVEKCRQSTDSNTCLAKISSKITNINLKLWKSVDNVEASINHYGLEVVGKIFDCGRTAIENYGNRLDHAATEITDCIDIES